MSGLPHYNPYSLNLQRCETGDSIGLFTSNFALIIQKKSPNDVFKKIELMHGLAVPFNCL